MKLSPLATILVVAFVDLMSFGLIIPLQAVYAERLGATGLTFGLIVGAYALMQLVFNPILGRWSDRIGRRRVLLISVGGSVISHGLLGVADLSHSLPLLFVARILDGITGANVATAQAYIADVTTVEDRAKGMGLFGAAFGLGFVVGPALGAGLTLVGRHVSGPAYGTSWPAFGAACISLVALLLVMRFLPEPLPAGGSVTQPCVVTQPRRILNLGKLRSVLLVRRLRELFLILFSTSFAFVLLEVTFVYLCAHRFGLTEQGTGLLFVYIGVMMVIVQGGLVGRLVHRFGEVRLLTSGPFITAVGFVLLATVSLAADQSAAWLLLLIGCIPVTLGQGLTTPNINALISHQAGENEQGAVLGLAQSVGSLARAIAPPLGGWLYDVGPAWPYWIGAVIFLGIGTFARLVAPAFLLRSREPS